MSQHLKIMNIVGARPNLPKIAPLMHEMRRRPAIDAIAMEMPVIFPVRPRTQQRLKQGGIQEETTALGVPCLMLRENTERPVTISEGTNLRVGTDPAKDCSRRSQCFGWKGKSGPRPASVGRPHSQTDGRDSLEVGATGKCIVGVSNNSSTAVPKGLAPLASFHYASGQ